MSFFRRLFGITDGLGGINPIDPTGQRDPLDPPKLPPYVPPTLPDPMGPDFTQAYERVVINAGARRK